MDIQEGGFACAQTLGSLDFGGFYNFELLQCGKRLSVFLKFGTPKTQNKS
jgi:hypothetical protein